MKNPRLALIRSLGLADATMLVIGCIVGVGIFRKASLIATYVPSPGWILILWLLGALVSMCGALCYAELAGMFPATGGDYVYISRIYGRFWGFLFGWTKLFIERTGTIAILAYVFAEYAQEIAGYSGLWVRWVAACAVALLTAVNVFGTRCGAWVQNTFTAVKLLALGGLIAAGLATLGAPPHPPVDWSLPALNGAALASMGAAFVFVLWTYGGWTEAAYVAGEVRDPVRNIPRAIIGGLALTAVLYVLVNWSYLQYVPAERLPDTPLVASSVMLQVLGAPGARLMAWLVACSAFGALNGYILTGGRILFAMGRHHALFAKLGTVDARYRTPALALWANAAVAIGLVFTKTLDQIATYSTVVISVFFLLGVIGVIILRRRKPRRLRPYRAWGYPITPLVFCLIMTAFILEVCLKRPDEALFGFALLALGVPLYFFSQPFRRRARR